MLKLGRLRRQYDEAKRRGKFLPVSECRNVTAPRRARAPCHQDGHERVAAGGVPPPAPAGSTRRARPACRCWSVSDGVAAPPAAGPAAAGRSSASRRAESEGLRRSATPAVHAYRDYITIAKRPARLRRAAAQAVAGVPESTQGDHVRAAPPSEPELGPPFLPRCSWGDDGAARA